MAKFRQLMILGQDGFPTGNRWHYTEFSPHSASKPQLTWEPLHDAAALATARRQALEDAARWLDVEQERSKHMHNYAAFYARAIRALMKQEKG